jgi:NADH dehydrogenase
MNQKRICLLGGSGFVGRRVAAQFVAAGHDVTVLTRHRDRHRDLLVLPTATVVEGDVHNAVFLRRQFDHHDAVVNLVGILNERGFSGRGFVRAHAELTEKVVEACRVARVPRLLHMSALHARLNAPSHYLRTKAMGEDTVHRAHSADLAVTSFRPSVLFGPGDSFLNRFAELLRVVPGVLPLACPKARFQPVFVDDVAQAFVRALDNHQTFNQRYDLCGPRVYTLRQIVEYTAALIGKPVKVLGLGQFASYTQALAMELVPGKPFSLDNYHSLQVDSVCQKGFPEIFGITPTALESVAPRYLRPVAGDAYAPLRASARR